MVCVLLGTGFEEMEAVAPVDLLRRAGVDVKFAGIGGDLITGANGITIKADVRVEDVRPELTDMVVLPGGNKGVASIGASGAATALIRKAYENGKYIAAICAAPTLLGKLGLLSGVTAVCYPSMEDGMTGAVPAGDVNVVQDGRIITGRAPGACIDFGLKLVAVLKGDKAADNVRRAIVYRAE